MAESTFEDDPGILDGDRLFRRIHPQQLVPDNKQSGKLRVSSAAFKDEELSIVIESLLQNSDRQPQDLLVSHPSYSLVAITAGIARANGQKVATDATIEEPAHGIVFGRKRKCAPALANSAQWIIPEKAPQV